MLSIYVIATVSTMLVSKSTTDMQDIVFVSVQGYKPYLRYVTVI